MKTFIELHIMRRTDMERRSAFAINPLYSLNGKTAEAWLLHLFSQEITEAGEDPNLD
ncbi:hypothetical protein BBR47_19430 [Brevibacillus brevis NBRC 100599]|uniref:Uncharacterized protein n=1 Tax=Brevibacillus brevis (strain 47 / JCM 6285 / NBRC 100599) TaxID=358681 RepID=C0ZAW1_BREBN|nr:hypothetical protein BBR47_19430 [Brevibacillus brevis NBRC 100599]